MLLHTEHHGPIPEHWLQLKNATADGAAYSLLRVQWWQEGSGVQEWLCIFPLTVMARLWNNWHSHPLLVRIQNIIATPQDSSALSSNTSDSLIIWRRNSQEVENLSPHKNLLTDVLSSFTQNGQNLKATKVSLSEWMDLAFWTFLKMSKYGDGETNEWF